jgi:hypothetical protein
MTFAKLFLAALSFFLPQSIPFPGPGAGGAPPIAILPGANGYTSCAANPNCSTPAIPDTTGATLIIATVSWYAGTAVITDSHAGCASPCNTWQSLTTYHSVSRLRIFYSYGPSVGANHVFSTGNSTGGFNYGQLLVSVWSGARTDAGVFDSGTDKGATSGSTQSLATGSITPSQAGELIYSAWSSNGGGCSTLAVGGGLAILPGGQCPTAMENASHAYLVDSSTSPINPAWSVTSAAEDMAVAIAAFMHP